MGELTRTQGPATIGIKAAANAIAKPDVGARVSVSGLFASLIASEGFQKFEVMSEYKVNDQLDAACSVTKDAKGVAGTAGITYTHDSVTTLRAKASNAGVVEAVLSYSPSKGMKFHAGGKYDTGKKSAAYGLSLPLSEGQTGYFILS